MFNPETHSLVLRACKSDMSSKNGFVWPTFGFVECPDWDDKQECGNGLHGWLYGHGDGSISNYWTNDSKWLVVSVETSTIVNLDGKIKFKNGNVLFCGTQKDATDFLMKHETRSLKQPVIGAFVTVGHNETATSGDGGTSTSGDNGTSTSGYKGTSTSGNYGKSYSGYVGTSTSGDNGTSTSGDNGTSTSGYVGTSTSGDGGTSTSGKYGKSYSGICGSSTSGDNGTSTSGYDGKCKAGKNGIISIYYFKNCRKRIKTGYIGEDGLEPDVFYKLDEDFNFVKCD